jgi:hypothetical protein
MTERSMDLLISDISYLKECVKDLQQRVFSNNGHSLESRMGRAEDRDEQMEDKLKTHIEHGKKQPASVAMWLMVLFSGMSMIAAFMTYMHTAK